MKEFKVLKILDCFRKIFEKLGVDYEIMRRILQVKFLMDGRRVPTIIGNTKKKDKETENSFIKSLWVYGLMGIILIIFVVMGENYIFQMGIIFGIIMFMIMTSLISDFSSVLLDIRDKNILLSKPVNSITVNMAKVIHIIVYLFFITAALVGPALVASLLKQGVLFFLLFFVEVILCNLFIVALTALFYLGILRFFDGEKLKDIINYVQIGLSIGITVGYQLVGRLFNIVDFNITFHPKWWQYFIIPIWFGGPFEVLLHREINFYYITFSILVILVPIISILLYIKLIPAFERSLQKLNNYSSVIKRKKGRLVSSISKVVCFSREEELFFHFASKMMKNEREFKLKVYPSLGFALIFPFIFIANSLRTDTFKEIASSNLYFYIYFCALFLPTVVLMMQYSQNYKGAWIYRVLPIQEVSPIFKGTLKSFLINLLLPIYLFESIIFLLIFGLRIFPDLIAVLLNILIYTVLSFKIYKVGLPFSKSFGAVQQSSGWIIFPMMILLAILGGLHYFCTTLGYGLYIYIIAEVLVNLILWKITFQRFRETIKE